MTLPPDLTERIAAAAPGVPTRRVRLDVILHVLRNSPAFHSADEALISLRAVFNTVETIVTPYDYDPEDPDSERLYAPIDAKYRSRSVSKPATVVMFRHRPSRGVQIPGAIGHTYRTFVRENGALAIYSVTGARLDSTAHPLEPWDETQGVCVFEKPGADGVRVWDP